MSDVKLKEDLEFTVRQAKPSLAQVKALVEFICKNPELAHKKGGKSSQDVKKLWVQLSNTVNSVKGTLKSTKGWTKFWNDKRRNVLLKHKQIQQGILPDTFSPIEIKILSLCEKMPPPRKRKAVKMESYNGNEDENSMDEIFLENEEIVVNVNNSASMTSEAEERQLNMMEKLVEVMDQQAQALAQMAQASQNNSKAMERLAEAAHIQAVAVDRLASTFENINSSVHDVRNAIVSIDYTMKRCYPVTSTQRQNTNLFN